MKSILVSLVGYYFFIGVATAAQVTSSQRTTDTASSFHAPCESSLQPIPAGECGFESNLDGAGNLHLTIHSPNHLNLSGQFGTDFPEHFYVSIPAEMIAHEPGVPLLSHFTQIKLDSDQSNLCGRFVRTELTYDRAGNQGHDRIGNQRDYDRAGNQLIWTYTTFSQCSHDNYSASLKLNLQENLSVQLIEYEGLKSAMAMCPGGYSHGFQHRFMCRWKGTDFDVLKLEN
jgi:hypothetical protein